MTPSAIKLHKKSKTLELNYEEKKFILPAELLRVYSPSAEVKGHGPGQEILQVGKRFVGIDKLESSGNYAIRIFFSDGHDSGIFSWKTLHQLCHEQETLWQAYLDKLHSEGASRDPDTQVLQFPPIT